MSKYVAAFWSESFWLPKNVAWKDVEPGVHGINHADYRDLVWLIPMVFVLIMFRFFTKRYFLHPLGKSLGVKSSQLKLPTSNSKLELIYKKNPKLDSVTLQSLTKQLDLSDREIQRWWRRRKAQDMPTTLEKFSENCFQFIFYSCNFSFGLSVLWDKPYLWNVSKSFTDYPNHEVNGGFWWYYMVSTAFYLLLTIDQLTNIKRKDFLPWFTHHIITLILFFFMWICNLHRIGSLGQVLHDCSDVFEEAAKALKHAKLQTACDIVFGIFTITWIVTRLLMFPRIIYEFIFYTLQNFFPVMAIISCLLILLLALHVFWTHLIYQTIVQRLKKSGFDRDVQSNSSETSDGLFAIKKEK